MNTTLEPDPAAACRDALEALHDACDALVRHQPFRADEVATLRPLVAHYADCGRQAHHAPRTVLAALRKALGPVVACAPEGLDLIQYGIDSYYRQEPPYEAE